jgi:hypothetical protein
MLTRGIWIALVGGLAACGGGTTTISAYYDGALFTASYRELGPGATANEPFSVLYQSDPGLVAGGAFVSVLSATADAAPIWHEVQVSGNQCAADQLCAAPAQLTSVAQILAAVGDGPAQIHLVQTGTRCSVVGMQPAAR